jgi:hypothetical protein
MSGYSDEIDAANSGWFGDQSSQPWCGFAKDHLPEMLAGEKEQTGFMFERKNSI